MGSSHVTLLRTTSTTLNRQNGLSNKLYHFILRLSLGIAADREQTFPNDGK